MKFLYMGDAHEHTDAPRCRIDDWSKTRTNKINEIRELAKKHKVKAILQGGDFLSSPKYGIQFLIEILNTWGYKVHNEALINEGAIKPTSNEAPLVGPIGNHELFGMSHKSYEKTSLSFLERNGFITIPTKENPLIFTSDEGFTVAVTCGNYEEGMDRTKEPYIVEEKKGDFHIHIVHGMLTKGKYFEDVPHTTIDEIKDTKADLTIAGHDHVGFGAIEHDGKFFVNPGSPFRLTSGEIKRKPKVLLVDITKDGIKIKTIYLKSAKDGVEVINPDVLEFKKERKSVLAEARERVGGQKSELGDINDIIKSMADNNKTRECIRDKAISRIADKIDNSRAKAIESSSSQLQEPYYISKLVLENFGSHEYSKFDFSPRMNVFIGPTSSGKTTILRAFRWLYDDYGNSKRFVKKGAEEARVTIYTSHGYIITRFCNIKKASKNGFEITYPDGRSETLNTKGVKVVQDILSYSKLDLETKKIDLNFLSQGSSWFFIGEDYSAGDRAKIIGSVYKTHLVDLAIKDLENESRKLAQKKEDRTKSLSDLDEKIKEFEFLKVMEGNIKELDKLEEILMEKFNTKNKIKELSNKKDILENKIKECENILSQINIKDLEECKLLLEDLTYKITKLSSLKPLIEKMLYTSNQIKFTEYNLTLIPKDNLDSGKILLNKLLEISTRLNKIKEHTDNLTKLDTNITKCEDILKIIDVEKIREGKDYLDELENKFQRLQDIKKHTSKISGILRDVNDIKKIQNQINSEKTVEIQSNLELLNNKMEKLSEMLALKEKQENILSDVAKIKKTISENNKKLELNAEIYKALLVRNEKCPICDSKITAIIANNIANSKINK